MRLKTDTDLLVVLLFCKIELIIFMTLHRGAPPIIGSITKYHHIFSFKPIMFFIFCIRLLSVADPVAGQATGQKNMKSMQLTSAAIFFMTYFLLDQGGVGHACRPLVDRISYYPMYPPNPLPVMHAGKPTP